MKTILKKISILFVVMLSFTITHANASIDSSASSVQLRTSCADGSGGVLNNCFDNQTALMDWIKNTRQPSAESSMVVEIGAGTYQRIEWLCKPGEGHVSFRGAGRGRTVFTDSWVLGNAMTFQNCEDLTFDSMTINAKFISVVWAGHGNAVWTDVELLAEYATWYETPADDRTSGLACPSGVNNEHKFFSSSLILTKPTLGATIYLNNCGVTWFYGSELVFDGSNSTMNNLAIGVKSSGAGHETHLYGSNIRLLSGSDSAINELIAYQSNANGQIHSHGTGIDLISENSIPITALQVNTGGMIHAAESAYVLKTGANGTVTRIDNNGGEIHAPHLWSKVPNTDGDSATIDTNYVTANGADQAVVTAGTSDGFPHPAIYSDQCPSTARWYDALDKVCRNN